ncbi:MAG: hypothetical protein AVDCRST_MAG76-3480 [uncultured Acidimicrobiales bacterium]|uniref:LytR/CpsA/Psr regulator C-terminal domain-containing protein n=1 Tax=uncultured Acidimicrobiales bacterium TaxID=310071 RepID=A0A6J4J6Z3_9ACTN|nr:MAG: hypothetical protein AVDCRST_MAG76-3480 [uncultured Acidimicrobiales bacterium]
MSRQAPPGGEAATWKGLVIIGGAVLLGVAVTASFGDQPTAIGSTPGGTEAPRTRVTPAPSTTLPDTTTTSTPLRDPKDVRVVVANATSTSGGSRKVIDALKPACYAVQAPVDATAKVKAEKRETTTVYSTPGYEREAAQITTKLGLQTTANAALPPDLPIPKSGVPTYNVLVLVGRDLVETPPQPLPRCETASGTDSSSTTASSRRGATTTRARSSATTARATTTTRASSTTTPRATTTVA